MLSTNSVDYSQLFELSDPLTNQPLRLSPVQEWINDDTVQQLFRGLWHPQEPVIMKGEMGGQVRDFLWSTYPPLLCVSQRVIDLLLNNRLTGWSTFPVDVYDRKGIVLPGYYGFAIRSSAGERDVNRSEILTRPPHGIGGEPYTVYRGLFFNESKWDGSDFFRVEGSKITTKRLKDAFVKAKITNVKFIPLTEFEIMTFIVDMRRKHRKENNDRTSQT